MKIRNLKIGKRLALSYAGILALLAILVVVEIMITSKMSGQLTEIVTDHNRKILLSNQIKSSFDRITLAIAGTILAKDGAIKLEEKKAIEAARTLYRESLAELEKLEDEEDGRVLIKNLKETITTGKDANNRALELAAAGMTGDAFTHYEQVVKPTSLKYAQAAEALVKFNQSEIMEHYERAEKFGRLAPIMSFSLGSAALALSILLGFTITRSIKTPIRSLVAATEKLAAGDTEVKLDVDSKDEIGMLADAFRTMAGNVTALVQDTKGLIGAATEGRLTVRADAAHHQGDFRKIVEGVNTTLDSLVGLIDTMPTPSMIIDKEFSILYINGAGAKAGGEDPRAARGHQVLRLFQDA